MLRKVKVEEVRLGMYIHELCGNWVDHPFWRKSFALNKQKDRDTLVNCGIREVWIDTGKGLDVQSTVLVDSTQSPPESPVEPPLAEAPEPAPRVPLQEEMARAKKIHAKAKRAVMSMFAEARMGRAISVEQVGVMVEEINQSISRNSAALLSLARLKHADDYTYLHSVAVCALMIALGRKLGLDSALLNDLGVAGLLHDVGKMFIPGEVLNKPGRLTDEEFAVVKRHPAQGWDLLKRSPGVSNLALDVCLHHHERVDGTGYPDRLSGEDFTLHARMGAICDVYDAITSTRCYKPGWAPAESIRRMAEWAKGGHFDETIFHAFVKTVGIYPTGTLVKLGSGRLGVVVEQTEESLLEPVVKVFFSARSNGPIPPELVDLSKRDESIAGVEDPRKWGLEMEKWIGAPV